MTEHNSSWCVPNGTKAVTSMDFDSGHPLTEFPNFTVVNNEQKQNHVEELPSTLDKQNKVFVTHYVEGYPGKLIQNATNHVDTSEPLPNRVGEDPSKNPPVALPSSMNDSLETVYKEDPDEYRNGRNSSLIPFSNGISREGTPSVDRNFSPALTNNSNSIHNIDSVSKNYESELDTESRDSVSVPSEQKSNNAREFKCELYEALSRQDALTPDTDVLSLATTASNDGDDSSQKSFDYKVRNGRKRRRDEDDDECDEDMDPVTYELKIGHRILKEFLVEANKSLTWPFLNAVDPIRDGVEDYYERVTKPMWLNKSKILLLKGYNKVISLFFR